MREFIFPLILSAFLMIGGVIIGLAPVIDPGFVHPFALSMTGIVFAMSGSAFAAWAIMAGLMERRHAELSAAIDYRLSR